MKTENTFYNFHEFRSSLMRYAFVHGMLDPYERTEFKDLAISDLKMSYAEIAHWFVNSDLIWDILRESESERKSLTNFIYGLIDIFDKSVINSKFKMLLQKDCVLAQRLLLPFDSNYSLYDKDQRSYVNDIKLMSGATVVTGGWQSGKSTFLNSVECEWSTNHPVFKYISTEDLIKNKYTNLSSILKGFKKTYSSNTDVKKIEKISEIYISEPDHQTFTFDIHEICSNIEKSQGPIFIDSVSKSEYYIKTLGLKEGISSSIIPVVDALNYYSHKLPIFIIGWSEMEMTRLSGSIVNLINITGEGQNDRDITVYYRGKINKPKQYLFKKKMRG